MALRIARKARTKSCLMLLDRDTKGIVTDAINLNDPQKMRLPHSIPGLNELRYSNDVIL